MKRKKVKDITPLKQTRISSFFTRTDSTKRLKTDTAHIPQCSGSPDIILCTPPSKQEHSRAKRSLGKTFQQESSEDIDSGFCENVPPFDSDILLSPVKTSVNSNASPAKTSANSNADSVKNLTLLQKQRVLKESSNKTRIFSTKTDAVKKDEFKSELVAESCGSPEIIASTPPKRDDRKAKRSLGRTFQKSSSKDEDINSGYSKQQQVEVEKRVSPRKTQSASSKNNDNAQVMTSHRQDSILRKGHNALNLFTKSPQKAEKTPKPQCSGSPDIISCTPSPSKKEGRARRSLGSSFMRKISDKEIETGNIAARRVTLPAIAPIKPLQDLKMTTSDKTLQFKPGDGKVAHSPDGENVSCDVLKITSFDETLHFESTDNKVAHVPDDVDVNLSCDVLKTTSSDETLHFKPADGKVVHDDDDNVSCDVLKIPSSDKTSKIAPADDKIQINAPDSPKKTNLSELNIDFDEFSLDDCWGLGSPKKPIAYSLDLEKCVKCTVISSEVIQKGIHREQILILKCISSEKLGRCILKDMWAYNVKVYPGDRANVLAVKQNGDYIVTATEGYFCLYPDLMISSTSLVGAMFCRRRGVLSNLFRGLDGDSKIMFMGSMVHEILQSALQLTEKNEQSVEKIIDEILTVPSNLRMLYSCNMALEETRRELLRFVPFVMSFLKSYVTQESQPTGDNFPGSIDEITDIEENVSSSNLGIKGRIDVTVNVKIHGRKKTMPLEVKTGRASFSNEHRSQVILYTMMMTDNSKKVDSGLLLYLKEGIMKEITPTYVEMRDLILLRNDFTQYLRKFERSNLPDPIQMSNACKKCPYLTVCSAYLDENTSEKHAIRTVAPVFKENHLEYFHKWAKLVLLEDSNEDKKTLKLDGLVLEDGHVELDNKYKYSFKRGSGETLLTGGNFVVLTSPSCQRVYNGRIIQITENQCSVLLEKKLQQNDGIFSVEGVKTSLVTRYLTNLGHLLEEQFHRLRSIVIEREAADFSESFPKSMLTPYCMEILTTLNEEQQISVLKILTCQNYMLIAGPPGSGKTQTIVAMIRVLISIGQRVLLVGHTHSSVDNVLIRIPEINYMRMGNFTSIREDVRPKSYSTLIESAKTVTDVEDLFIRPLIASTCLGLDDDIISHQTFDVCIVDESSQVLQPEVLKPLFAAKKFVLIGDSKQLRPVVKNTEAKSLGMDVSIFEWLEAPEAVVTLNKQYRMNRPIMNLANKLTYDGVLKAGSESVETNVLNLTGVDCLPFAWLRKILSCNLDNSVCFLDTSDYLIGRETERYSVMNSVEANIVLKVVDALLSCGVLPQDIGIMAPYRSQIQVLNEIMPENVEVNTVDQYQGRDKSVVIFSCTKQDRSLDKRSDFEILNDFRRLTVAITRAKFKLLMIGDKMTLSNYKTFEKLFGLIDSSNIVAAKEGDDDFSWKQFM